MYGEGPAGPELAAVLRAVEGIRPALRRAEDPAGGLRRSDLLEVLGAVLPQADGSALVGGTFSASSLHLSGAGWAVSAHAGRAYTNNDALLALLAAAAAPSVDALVLVVPLEYKGGAAADRVAHQIRSVLVSPGVELALSDVVLLSF